jgi:hypothetical protein
MPVLMATNPRERSRGPKSENRTLAGQGEPVGSPLVRYLMRLVK